MDVVILSRLQFALTIMFHYLFPPLTIGLSVVVVYLLGMRLRTRLPIYEAAARFWTRIFGINFALGVATGVVMEFQFGTNWAAFSRFVGDVFGSAVAAEGIFAFFLESGFLAVLLFGWDRISPRFHFLSAVMVSLGSIFSAVWIVIANSWLQTPAGSVLREHTVGARTFLRAEITDFWAVVFSPSSMNRLAHVWTGAFLLGAFFVMSISAWYLLRRRHEDFARRSFSGALLLATFFSLAQLLSGHRSGVQVARTQPAKLAAFEAIYHTEPEGGTRMFLFGIPSDEEQKVYGVSVPDMLSFFVYGRTDIPVPGLDQLGPLWGRPPVAVPFLAFHLMVAIGVFFIAVTLLGSYLHIRQRLFEKRWLLWVFVFSVLPAFAANQLGWVAAEVGRQPWVVYPTLVDGTLVGGLRTEHGVSEALQASHVLGSIIMFGLIYTLLFAIWVWVLNHWIQRGPAPVGPRPISAPRAAFLDIGAERVAHEAGLIEEPVAARPPAERRSGLGTGREEGS
jgi:cytochrome bd ubiquinol oxidase subunit I